MSTPRHAFEPGLVGTPAGPGGPVPRRALPRRRRGRFDGLFAEVQWTPAFVGLLIYVFAVVTYRAPVAVPGLVIALAGIFLSGAKVRVPPVLIAFGAFILWGAVGYTQSGYSWAVWDRLILLGKLWLIGLVIVNALRTPAQIRLFIVFFLVCFATHPARGAIFNYFYGYTVFGRALWNHIYANPNDLAALTLFPLGLAMGLMKDVNIWVRRGALASLVVLTILMLMTQSRGGFLALALIGAVGIFSVRTQRKRARALVAGGLIAMTAVVVAPAGIWDRVSGLSEGTEADTSSQQRWEIWHVAGEIASDHRLFGVGLGAYRWAHYDYTVNDPRFALSRGARDTHSTYLNVRAEAGWPGLIIFLTMIGISLREATRARRRLKRYPAESTLVGAVALVLIGYLAAGIFATVPHLAFLYVHLALLTVLSRAALSRPRPRRRPPPLGQATPGGWAQPVPAPTGTSQGAP